MHYRAGRSRAGISVAGGRRKSPHRGDDRAAPPGDDPGVMPGACPEVEVERSVRDRLYGERTAVTTAPTPRIARRTGPGRLAGGRYRLLERLGVGGMATVYRARDERLKRDVAVKVIAQHLARDREFVRRFRGEAELCAGLAHPNVVAVLDAGAEPRDFIVMELVKGVDAGTLQRRGSLKPGQTVHLVAQVCDALAYVHEQGVVHHDVSLRNILISQPEGTAKLADFGLASRPAGGAPRAVPGVMGTPGYVAPEILSGAGPSPRSDIYSVGVVAYRLLAGRPGVRPRDPRATALAATALPRMPALGDVRPDLPRRLIESVEQAVARDPGARQGSAAQFGAQLVEAQSAPLRLERGGAALPEAVRAELARAA